jgi:gliding motility-associated-like protein
VTAPLPVFYKWEFGDAQSSTEEAPVHKYISAIPPVKNIKLTVSYSSSANVCDNFKTSSITIDPAPVAEIISPGNPDFKFCAGETLTLKTSNSFDTYKWSNGKEDPTIEVEEGGEYTVEVTIGSCTLNAEKRTIEPWTPHITITADPPQIAEGQSAQLTASGLEDYTWSPAESLDNPLIANPTASPLVTTTYSVTGKDSVNCTGTATFELEVKGEPIVNKLNPSNMISPNDGNGQNDFWSIEKILDYPQCNIAIYDDKGIKIFEAKPYNNDWDGTFKGKKLPDGVYYYVIRCDGEESKPKSGSITLLR